VITRKVGFTDYVVEGQGCVKAGGVCLGQYFAKADVPISRLSTPLHTVVR
jgi:hypothetical protein